MTISFSKIGISAALSLLAIWLAVLTPPAANAITAEEMLTDPALESRARDLSQQLRCLVCQNQSIDDSDADLARDLRREVRIQLLAGADDNAILSQLRQKYGDYVLLNPPVDQSTLVLWLAPIGFVALGAFLVLVARRQKTDQKTDLDSDERARVERLLASRNSEEQAKT